LPGCKALSDAPHQLILDRVWQKSSVDRADVAFQEIGCAPSEGRCQFLVFETKCDGCQGTVIGADAQRYILTLQSVNAVIGIGWEHIELDVAGWADLQMNVLLSEISNQRRILDASHTVANAGRLDHLQGFPNTLRPTCLARVRGERQVMIRREPERFKMCSEWIARFVTRQVKSNDPAAAELIDQLHGLQTLLGCEVS
jgi:hypothetical protein